MATTEQWKDDLASCISSIMATLAALTARVEALEAQAHAAQPAQAEQDEQGRGPEPQPKSLWLRMNRAWLSDNVSQLDDWARVMDAVADWLESRLDHGTAAALLRVEAQATRDGRRG